MTRMIIAVAVTTFLCACANNAQVINQTKQDTLLTFAIEQGNRAEVKSLVNERNINKKDFEGKTPLLKAAEKGNPDMLRVLLKAGARVDTQDSRGNNPLHAVTRAGAISAAKILLKHKGIGINAANKFGYTPLHTAVLEGNHRIARMLLKAGADPKIKVITTGETAVDLVRKLRQKKMQYLFSTSTEFSNN